MSERKYGHLLENWLAAKQQMREILIQCAQAQQTITYGELSSQITAARIPAHSYGMVAMLSSIVNDDEAEEKGHLATLVVRKSDGRPGPGYYHRALAIGLIDENNLEAYWQAAFEKVCEGWKNG
ncbi:hypothetical protein MASR2M15_28540 [Anaerolineales bacterium]